MQFLLLVFAFISILLLSSGSSEVFDRYSAKKVADALKRNLRLKNATQQCSIEVRKCGPHEGSRVDGTCNNYKYPSTGSAFGPYLRLLRPDYANRKDIRADKNGNTLPSARRVRTVLQSTGRVEDRKMFTVAAAHMLEFVHRDISIMNGPLDYLRRRQYCCQAAGAADSRCIPIEVPSDDPYLKVTDIRCLNFSRAETFQNIGCIPETIMPEQINYQTPLFDLSTIYGVNETALASVREGESGLLRMEHRNNRYVPLINMTEGVCFQNRVNETVCYKFGFPEAGNFDLRTTTLTIFFMREHNRLAKILLEINPCWKDDRLFKVARQINIATAVNIFMYELLPLLLGYRNMQKYGLVSEHVEYLSGYDEDAVPLIYAEFDNALRFYHTFLNGRIKRYNENYQYINELSLSDTLFRQDLIEQNKTFEEMNRGTFYQHADKIDDIQDPEISEKFYGEIQRAHDQAAIAIQRGRDVGIRGYNDYRHLCGLKPAKNFGDFSDVIEIEKIEILKSVYRKVEDIDLLAGIMSENFIQGTYVGPTLFCIVAKQLQLMRFSDRFWFERGDQFHSLTLPQLHEIRKTNMARVACDNAEAIKFIQPNAFVNIKPGNNAVPCTHILGPDLTKWRDYNCPTNKHMPRQEIQSKPVQRHTDYSEFFNNFLSYTSSQG